MLFGVYHWLSGYWTQWQCNEWLTSRCCAWSDYIGSWSDYIGSWSDYVGSHVEWHDLYRYWCCHLWNWMLPFVKLNVAICETECCHLWNWMLPFVKLIADRVHWATSVERSRGNDGDLSPRAAEAILLLRTQRPHLHERRELHQSAFNG